MVLQTKPTANLQHHVLHFLDSISSATQDVWIYSTYTTIYPIPKHNQKKNHPLVSVGYWHSRADA